ncbi:MAG: rhodanese-like domain-containing protein [Bacteroidetes bacterium]|nr:rhodanese-like domain-containing protein [Bacteroidota bacterium]
MRKINLLFLVVFIFSIGVYGCTKKDSSYKSITVEQLKKEMKENPDMIILDVRTPQELEGPLGHIDGVINIPVQILEKRISELNKYKDKEITVICRSGNRSGIASEILFKKNFNITNVEGGMIAYRKSEK